MQLFVKDLSGKSLSFVLDDGCLASCLKSKVQDRCGIPVAEQLLVHGGRVLFDNICLADSGLISDSTVELSLRLLGGKGGFGALLRGQGRDGKITTNYDACRDLSGKRIRHTTTDEKLADWQAKAKERELEKVALQHIKELAKKTRQDHEQEVTVEEVKAAQRETVAGVQDAVQDALQALKETESTASKRKAEAKQPVQAVKRSKVMGMLEDISSDDSDSDDGGDSDSEDSDKTANDQVA